MDTIEILKKYCKQKYGEEVVIKTYSIQEVKDIIDFTKEQCTINGVVFNEANQNSKEHQGKLLREIMQGDEELGLYSEVEFYCEMEMTLGHGNRCKKECEHCIELKQ